MSVRNCSACAKAERTSDMGNMKWVLAGILTCSLVIYLCGTSGWLDWTGSGTMATVIAVCGLLPLMFMIFPGWIVAWRCNQGTHEHIYWRKPSKRQIYLDLTSPKDHGATASYMLRFLRGRAARQHEVLRLVQNPEHDHKLGYTVYFETTIWRAIVEKGEVTGIWSEYRVRLMCKGISHAIVLMHEHPNGIYREEIITEGTTVLHRSIQTFVHISMNVRIPANGFSSAYGREACLQAEQALRELIKIDPSRCRALVLHELDLALKSIDTGQSNSSWPEDPQRNLACGNFVQAVLHEKPEEILEYLTGS